MAQIVGNQADRIYTISSWLGVNENQDGDTGIKMGEASTMTNYKITNSGHLRKRPGTANVANLLYDSSLSVAASPSTVLTEHGISEMAITAYPNAALSSGGIITLSGTSHAVTYANAATYVDYYFLYESNYYKLSGCAYTAASGAGTTIDGGIVSLAADPVKAFTFTYPQFATLYNNIKIQNSAVVPCGSSQSVADFTIGSSYKYISYGGNTYEIAYSTFTYPGGVPQQDWWGKLITIVDTDDYVWTAKLVTIGASSSEADVMGLWSGLVGSTEYIVAACNGSLWTLSETDGAWTKTEIGSITTTAKVHMFGFDSKLYFMNGTEYKVWNGTTLSTVTGYVPLLATAVPYSGGGTLVEQVNKLTAKRRVQFSPDGTHYVFQLPETGIASVNYVKNLATSSEYTVTTHYSVSTTNGTVTFVSAKSENFTGNGSQTVFQLANTKIVSITSVTQNGTPTSAYTYNSTTNQITFNSAPSNGVALVVNENLIPASGTSTIEVEYSAPTSDNSAVVAMTISEMFNGLNDNRVFIYGDGSNKAFYSGIEYATGKASAEYFPDLYEVAVGDTGSALTSLIRHNERLLAYKKDSAYSIRYDTLTLINGVVTPGFYVSPISKVLGCHGLGQAVIVENNPRTLDGRSIYQWIATSSAGNLTADQRNADRISQKVDTTLRGMDFDKAITFYDKINHEYFVVEDGVAIIQNTENGTWYIYRDFPANCMIVYKDELYFGTADGYIRHVSDTYKGDVDSAITCYWESGAMMFGKNFMKKYTDYIYVLPKPEDDANVNVTVLTDVKRDYEDTEVVSESTVPVSSGFFSFLDLNFLHFTFNVNSMPSTHSCKIKAKNYIGLKLIFSSVTNDTTITIVESSIKVRETSKVR